MGLMESVCSVELQCEDTDYLTHLVFKMLHISIHCELSYMSLCECCDGNKLERLGTFDE